MKQIFLAAALIAVPVAAFTGYNLYAANAATTAGAPAASLGDLSTFITIVSDVQTIAGTGDLGAAKVRIKDFEIAWDQAEPGLKPMDPVHWTTIDEASDATLSALRAKTPEPATVTETLAALLASLRTPAEVTK